MQRLDPGFVTTGVGATIRLFCASGIVFVITCGQLPAKETGTAATVAAPPKTVRPDSNLYDRSWVGPLSDGRVIVPTNQILSPAGRQLVVGGRPADVALSPNEQWLAVLNVNEVQLIDVESGKILSRVAIRGGSFKGI